MPLLSRLFSTSTRKMALTPLAQIPTLTYLYQTQRLQPSSDTFEGSTSKFNDKVSLIRTDITKLEVDAIVNAANESLLGGGGVDGSIHRAAGPQLVDECAMLDGCDTGSAKITGAYRLPCQRVIHAVGPVYGPTKRLGKHTELLQGCYTTSLDLAAENECRSIAFSALSTGVYGYPSGEAAETAIEAVKEWLEVDEERASKMDKIIFCSFMEKDEKAYEKYIPKFFPPAPEAETKDEAPADEAEGETAAAPTAEGETSTSNSEGKKADDGDKTPNLDLPDVPKEEPTAAGEPQPKKAKLEDEGGEKKE